MLRLLNAALHPERAISPRQPALTGNGGEDDVAVRGNNRSRSPMRVCNLKESISEARYCHGVAYTFDAIFILAAQNTRGLSPPWQNHCDRHHNDELIASGIMTNN